MSGENYYSSMKEIFDGMPKNGSEGDSVKKNSFMNMFCKKHGLKLVTAMRWFDMAVDIHVIEYVGDDCIRVN